MHPGGLLGDTMQDLRAGTAATPPGAVVGRADANPGATLLADRVMRQRAGETGAPDGMPGAPPRVERSRHAITALNVAGAAGWSTTR